MTQSQQLPQLALLERITDVLRAMQNVRAAFLRGSFNSGQPDVYSGLDLIAVVDNLDDEARLSLARAGLVALGRALWISAPNTLPPQLRALFPGPIRLDLTLVEADALPLSDDWRVLFDYDGLSGATRQPAYEPLLP